jgi:hypothetical protein
VIAKALRWLQANHNLSHDQIQAKYPTLTVDCLAEIKAEDAHYGLPNRELPNLLTRVIHYGRLGKEIDDVLGLAGTSNAAREVKKEDEAREFHRYSSKS